MLIRKHLLCKIYLKLLYKEYLRFIPDLLYRGGADEAAGGRHQVPLLLADAGGGVQGGGPARPLPRPRHAARAPDPQHGHHDGHLRAHGLHAPPDLLHQLVLARHGNAMIIFPCRSVCLAQSKYVFSQFQHGS